MPTFTTPQPINLTVDVGIGKIWISASDRTDTVVEMRPTDETNQRDLKAVKQTRVDYANGTLLIKQTQLNNPFNKVGSMEISIELPTGSQVTGEVGVGGFRCAGQFGECRFKTGVGDVMLDRTGRLNAHTSAGGVIAEYVSGHADVHAGAKIHIREIDGTAVIRNLNGDTELGSITGDLRVNSSNGDIQIGFAGGDVSAKTANGHIRVNEVVRGSATLATSIGEVEVGIREGSAAWLDVRSSTGRVRNSMERAEAPGEDVETVKVHARSTTGDILIYRA